MSRDERFHGPLSPVGAGVGVVLALAPYSFGVFSAAGWAVALGGPVVGLALLLVAGPARHVGTGLVASALTLPLLFLALLVVGAFV